MNPRDDGAGLLSTGEVEAGGTPRAQGCLASVIKGECLIQREMLSQKNKVDKDRERHLTLTSDLHVCTHMDSHVCITHTFASIHKNEINSSSTQKMREPGVHK